MVCMVSYLSCHAAVLCSAKAEGCPGCKRRPVKMTHATCSALHIDTVLKSCWNATGTLIEKLCLSAANQ